MILVDTSVWIDFLSANNTPTTQKLEDLIENREDLCICGIVLTEVLQGINNDKEYLKTKELLENLILFETTGNAFVLAADIYRMLRKKGVTIRNTIDCLIAAVCIEHNARLLHNDRDFIHLTKHAPLKPIQN